MPEAFQEAVGAGDEPIPPSCAVEVPPAKEQRVAVWCHAGDGGSPWGER